MLGLCCCIVVWCVIGMLCCIGLDIVCKFVVKVVCVVLVGILIV